ncbi:HET-domain-containing protein [Dothidotthia symphoricarpi CBS 119687]|uniref:HET-domain-containing protein n=1 Tax=Dothidotthia symphoricarpi CBS 119687 TaxID=1392245 RepID=A0A6A6A2U4_9PLEO|nr:HET-domain-containing protein [Dothidotthia symphoricarpi CBS 119687]KAF2125227.1 HET-domain-containing protein [Dothidotthia symphoricarpi CBS 119687]
MLPYRYRTLQHADSIRLLTLHPSLDDQSPITCTIQEVRLSDAQLKYEALSYTWGDVTYRQSIYFHGGRRELQIGANCYNALRHLRRKDHDRQVWLDAICIDQSNLDERADQVRLMDQIFQSASGVVVHLGEETSGSRELFEELAEADNDPSWIEHGRRTWPSDIIIEQLEILIQRPWFKRVWVLQEVHNMKGSITFMCGSSSASGKALEGCLFGYRYALVTDQPYPCAIGLMTSSPNTHSTAQYCLWNLLYESRDCLATDPRDKVFALRSLINQNRSHMDSLINYFKSVEEIFTETALFLLPVIGLRLLTAVRHPHELNTPSWIPDWSQCTPLDWCFFSVFPNMKPSPGYAPVRAGYGRLELHLLGIRYAQISCRSQAFWFSSVEDAKAQMKGLYCQLGNLRKLFVEADMREDATRSTHLEKSIIDAMSQLSGPTLHRFINRGYVTDIQPSDIATDEIFALPHLFFESLQQCRIVLLDNNQICIAPDAACTGDTVCFLRDANSPCILRQGLNGDWTLVSGNCDVYGVDFKNDGAGFTEEVYLDEHGVALETFVIR